MNCAIVKDIEESKCSVPVDNDSRKSLTWIETTRKRWVPVLGETQACGAWGLPRIA